MPHSSTVVKPLAVVALVFGLTMASPSLAQNVPGDAANKCLAGKTACVTKAVAGLLSCRQKCQKSPKKCGQAQADCQAKVVARYTGGGNPDKACFAKWEAKERVDKADTVCTTTGDIDALGADVDYDVAALLAALENVCTDEVFVCPDGSVVSRDPAAGCAFGQCPAQCTTDVLDCNDGIFVGRDPANGCAFSDCPPPCTADLFMCPDGSFVERDRLNSCQFPDCP